MKRRICKVLILLGAGIFAALSVVFAVYPTQNAWLRFASYVIDALAAVFLGAVVYLVLQFFKQHSVKQHLSEAAHKTELIGRIYDDYTFRTLLIGYGSLAISIFFALTKAAFGWFSSSVWLMALAFYYLFLCVTKALVLRQGRKRIPGETANERLLREWKIYRLCGGLLMGMTFALQGIIILMVEQGKTRPMRPPTGYGLLDWFPAGACA